MTDDERSAIEAAGFRVTTIKELLGLTDEEVEIIEERVRQLRSRSRSEVRRIAFMVEGERESKREGER